ncbi:hypothetical protein [Rickettsia canadensis]|uniref:hypothetical protein n=1 Tax=Rickettsia canadensis TaxID=788 RepID=UPI0018C8A976|nr:hypothetical protein [Rickettsia canadensis]
MKNIDITKPSIKACDNKLLKFLVKKLCCNLRFRKKIKLIYEDINTDNREANIKPVNGSP